MRIVVSWRARWICWCWRIVCCDERNSRSKARRRGNSTSKASNWTDMMNPFKEVNWKPDVAERRKFARSLVIGFPCIAVVLILAGWMKTGVWKIQPALIIGGTGLVIGLVLLALPGIARPFYVIWYGLACTI